MLDLDAIANARAAALAQDQAPWRAAVWDGPFQALSAQLTDGEVVDLLALCASAPELTQLTRVLVSSAAAGAGGSTTDVTPLDWLKREAEGQGLSPTDWVKRHARPDPR